MQKCGFLILALAAFGCDGGAVEGGPDAGPPPPPEATTTSGPVRGTRGDGYQAFLGIPYAAPPVGDLRFRAPVAPEPWSETRSTTVAPPRCMQSVLGLPLGSQEDCLYLNVHAPDPRPQNAPVLVWIHGGAFLFGEGLQTDGGTAGDLLASQHGAVVVSINYRLGAFGFLAHPDLTAEAGASGNYGFADQIAALRWVQENIAAFGGDPNNVTIFGESAGGVSVCAHLVSPASQGLFHRAITQSGLCDTPYTALADAERTGQDFALQLGCRREAPACMRALSAEAILAADGAGNTFTTLDGSGRRWWPIVDGALLTDTFRARVAAGGFHDVPTIVGWNGDEGTLFVMLAEQDGTIIDAVKYEEVVLQLSLFFGESADAVRAQYPINDDPAAAVAALLGDATLACPSRRAARLLANAGANVRVYHFTYTNAAFQLAPTRPLGAFHSAEIQYIFGHPATLGRLRFPADDQALHEAIAGYWTRFAASGDPNGDGAPSWPVYDTTSDLHLGLDLTIGEAMGASADRCALWEP